MKIIYGMIIAVSFSAFLCIVFLDNSKAQDTANMPYPARSKLNKVKRIATSRLIMTSPEDACLESDIVFSTDKSASAVAYSMKNKNFLMVNGKIISAYDEYRNIRFDGLGRIHFNGRLGNNWHVVRGDNKGPGFFGEIVTIGYLTGKDSFWYVGGTKERYVYQLVQNDTLVGKPFVFNEFFFSPDGKKLVVTGSRDGKPLMFLNGSEKSLDDSISFNRTYKQLFFDDNSSLRQVRVLKNEDLTYTVLFEDRKHRQYREIDHMALSRDGRQIAYSASYGQSKDEVMVLNGIQGAGYKKVGYPLFSPDGSKLAYDVLAGHSFFTGQRKFAVVLNEKEGREYSDVGSLTFSPDSSTLAYTASKDDKNHFVVINNVEGKPYKEITQITFSPDSKKIAYIAQKEDGKKIFVINGQEGKAYADIRNVIFSPDSRYYAYCAMEYSDWFVVINGSEGVEFNWISKPGFTPDGNRISYGAKGGMRMIKDSNGKLLAYPIREKNGEKFREYFVDGQGLTYPGRKGQGQVWTNQEGLIYEVWGKNQIFSVEESLEQLPESAQTVEAENPGIAFAEKTPDIKSLYLSLAYKYPSMTSENLSPLRFTFVPEKKPNSSGGDISYSMHFHFESRPRKVLKLGEDSR